MYRMLTYLLMSVLWLSGNWRNHNDCCLLLNYRLARFSLADTFGWSTIDFDFEARRDKWGHRFTPSTHTGGHKFTPIKSYWRVWVHPLLLLLGGRGYRFTPFNSILVLTLWKIKTLTLRSVNNIAKNDRKEFWKQGDRIDAREITSYWKQKSWCQTIIVL